MMDLYAHLQEDTLAASQDQVVVVPASPGFLMLPEIATLAGVKLSTMRSYRVAKRGSDAGFPQPTTRTGTIPMWSVDVIIDWLANREYSRTVVEQQPDGSLVVTNASDYRERKATGTVKL